MSEGSRAVADSTAERVVSPPVVAGDKTTMKLRTASESVGWMNSEGPLTTSPQFQRPPVVASRPLDLKAIRQRLADAPKNLRLEIRDSLYGYYTVQSDEGRIAELWGGEERANFFACAGADIEALLVEVERLRAERDEYKRLADIYGQGITEWRPIVECTPNGTRHRPEPQGDGKLPKCSRCGMEGMGVDFDTACTP